MIIVDDIGGFLKWGNHPRHLDHFSKPMVLGIHNVIVIPNSIKKLFIFIYFMVIVPIIIYIYIYTLNGFLTLCIPQMVMYRYIYIYNHIVI